MSRNGAAALAALILTLSLTGGLRADSSPSGDESLAGQAPSFTCAPLIRGFLDLVVRRDFAIEPILARRIKDFDQQFMGSQAVIILSDENRAECRKEAVEVFARLVKRVNQRLTYLLVNKQDLDAYYGEFSAFLFPWNDLQRQLLAQSPIFGQAHQTYSRMLYTTLREEIIGMKDRRFERFLKASIDLVAWTRNWTSSLGRLEPGAVEFETHRIALRTHDHEPAAMKIFLFHELAHLADPDLAKRASSERGRYENELYAWQQTFEFLEARRREGISMPPHFQYQVLPVVERMGLEPWVKAVMESRFLSF